MHKNHNRLAPVDKSKASNFSGNSSSMNLFSAPSNQDLTKSIKNLQMNFGGSDIISSFKE